jgi:hypothetical protein
MTEGRQGPRSFAPDKMPVTFRNQSGVELHGETRIERSVQGEIVRPADAAEAAHFNAITKTCGSCQKFNQSDAAIAEIRSQKFYQRLVREDGWKLKHLGSDPSTHGLCDETSGDDTKLTGAFHKACEHYRENRGLVRIGQKAR